MSYSLDMRQAAMAEGTEDFLVTLLTFTHDELDAPVRLTSDQSERITEDPLLYGTISRGDTFLWVPMSVIFPGDDDQSAPEFRLVIDAVDREIFAVIRASRKPATCKIELVLSTDLDSVEQSFDGFKTVSAPYDEGQVTVSLSQETFWGEPWPAGRMTPKTFPGLHR